MSKTFIISGWKGAKANVTNNLLDKNYLNYLDNFEIKNGSILRSRGYTEFSTASSLVDLPDKCHRVVPLQFVISGSIVTRIIALTEKYIYVFDDTTQSAPVWTNISQLVGTPTPAAANYGATAENPWSVTMFLNKAYFSCKNMSTAVQSWDGSLTSKLIDASGVPTGSTFKMIDTFYSHLIGIYVRTSGTDYPFACMISDIADPTNWTTNEAGQLAISDGGDVIVAGKKISNSYAIYKTTSIWLLTYVSGTIVFELVQNNNIGAWGMNSIVPIHNYHYFMARSPNGGFYGFYVFNGSYVQKMEGSDGIEAMIRSEINPTYPDMVYGFYNPDLMEIIWLYPSVNSSNGYPDKAVVCQLEEGTWSLRGNYNIHCMSEAVINSNVLVDNGDGDGYYGWGFYKPITLDEIGVAPYTGSEYQLDGTFWVSKNKRVLGADSTGKLVKFNGGQDYLGTGIIGQAVRTDIVFDDQPTIKHLNKIIISINGSKSGTIGFQLGYRNSISSSEKVWLDPIYIDVHNGIKDYSYNIRLSSVFWSYKIIWDSNCHGGDMEINQLLFEYNDGGRI
jgi:hypothetical protein